MARNSLLCADVPLRNYSLTHNNDDFCQVLLERLARAPCILAATSSSFAVRWSNARHRRHYVIQQGNMASGLHRSHIAHVTRDRRVVIGVLRHVTVRPRQNRSLCCRLLVSNYSFLDVTPDLFLRFLCCSEAVKT